MNASPLPHASTHSAHLALHRLRNAVQQLRAAGVVPASLAPLLDQLDGSSRLIEATLQTSLGELHDFNDGLTMALRLLSEAGETPLSGHGMLCLLRPLHQQHAATLQRVNDLI